MSSFDNAPVPTGNRVQSGAVFRREGQRISSTHDQRMLRSPVDASWTNGDPWRVLRVQAEFVEGFSALAELGPAISIFGSARSKPGDPMYESTREIASRLVKSGFAVITGGGPGLMEAANRGAADANGTSVGLGIELPFETALNDWVNLGINFRYFFARKVMFLKYAQGFIVMPGGYGTFDELFEALTLVQTDKILDFPIVLFGKSYWQGLVDWLREQTLTEHFISPEDLDRFLVTDDIDQAVAHAISGARE